MPKCKFVVALKHALLLGLECTDIEFDGFLKKRIFCECYAAFYILFVKFQAAMLVRERFWDFKPASDFE